MQADSRLAKQEVVELSEKSSDKRSGVEKPRKLDVSSVRLGKGEAIDEIQQQLEIKENELVRAHNRSYAREGAERLRAFNLCGLGNVGMDEMIGRLLETKAMAEKDPGKIEEWIKVGAAFRLEHNPQDRAGYFSAVVLNVPSDDQSLLEQMKTLGLKYAPRYDSYDGTIDIAAALSALRGTDATLRVRIGRSGKGKDSYIVALEKGKEVEGARAILFGDDAEQDEPVMEVSSTRAERKPAGTLQPFGMNMTRKPGVETGTASSGEEEKDD